MTEATAEGDLASTATLAPPAEKQRIGRAWAASTLAALESPVYRLIWFGSLLGFMAFHMSGTAQSVVAFDLTGNNRAVGFVMFGQGVAMLLLNPFGGTIADRLNKRLLLLFTQSVLGGVILTTGILLETGMLSIPLLAAGAFITGTMFAFLGPARASILGEVLPQERVGNAIALLQVGGNVGRIIAPFLAGALLSWALLGASGTYFVISCMLVVVLAFTWKIPETGARGSQGRSVFDDMKLGLAHVRSRPRLLHAIVSYYLLTMLGFSFFVLMPGFVKQELGRGTAEVGAMLGIAAAGGFVGSVVVASLADSKRAPTYLRIAGAVGAAGLIAVGFAPGLVPALAAMLFVGGGIAAFQTLNNSVALKLADPAYFGRVMGLMQVAWGMINLTSLPVGALADAFGERIVLSGAGAGLGIALLALTVWERRLVQRPPVAP